MKDKQDPQNFTAEIEARIEHEVGPPCRRRNVRRRRARGCLEDFWEVTFSARALLRIQPLVLVGNSFTSGCLLRRAILRRRPGLTAVVILSLGIGIGSEHGDLQHRKRSAPQGSALPGRESSDVRHRVLAA